MAAQMDFTARQPRSTWMLIPASVVLILYGAATGGAGYAMIAGLHSMTSPVPVVTSSDTHETIVPTESLPPFLDWPEEKPDAVLVLSGQLHGYMRPCGCTEGQLGGLHRRSGFLKYLAEEKGWGALPLDMGDLIKSSGEMEKLRYHYTLESLKEMDYPVVGVGSMDLKLDVDTLIGEAINSNETKLVQANLQHEYKQMLPDGWFKEIVVKTVGDVTVGTSVLMAPGQDSQLELESLDKATQRVAGSMEATKPEVRVLLVHAGYDDALALAERHPHFDVVVSLSDYADASSVNAKWVGDTMVTKVGQMGKGVGVVGYWSEGSPRLRFEVVQLDRRFDEDPAMNEIYARYINAIKDDKFLEREPKFPDVDGNKHVGAEACATCHKEIYDHWKTTRHAHALETLVNAKPPGLEYNPECVQCHVVGLQSKSGFVTIEKTPKLGGVQCENCHGPGHLHASQSTLTHGSRLESVRRSRFTTAEQCAKCHNTENDPHFEFEKYWPKVEHPRVTR